MHFLSPKNDDVKRRSLTGVSSSRFSFANPDAEIGISFQTGVMPGITEERRNESRVAIEQCRPNGSSSGHEQTLAH